MKVLTSDRIKALRIQLHPETEATNSQQERFNELCLLNNEYAVWHNDWTVDVIGTNLNDKRVYTDMLEKLPL